MLPESFGNLRRDPASHTPLKLPDWIFGDVFFFTVISGNCAAIATGVVCGGCSDRVIATSNTCGVLSQNLNQVTDKVIRLKCFDLQKKSNFLTQLSASGHEGQANCPILTRFIISKVFFAIICYYVLCRLRH